MMFSKLAELFKKLSATSKRLEMTDYLADFLKNTKCGDIGFVVLLSMGKIFPKNEEKELGIANSIIIDALARASGIDKQDVMKKWRETGDLGETAKFLISNKKQRTLASEDLSMNVLKDDLRKIANITGKGSVDKKLSIISKLLNSASSDEALYITRIILGNMRTGIGKGTVRDALAKAFNADAKDVEKAYNLCTDYSLVAEVLCKNPKDLKNINITLFTPINEMLFQKVDSAKEAFEKVGKPAIIEIKYDGMRAQIHKKGKIVRIFTRNLDEVTNQFPDAVEYVNDNVKSDEIIFECEMVGFNPKTDKPLPFQKLSRRVKRKYDIKGMEKEIPVKLFCFDLLMLKGESYLNKDFEVRHDLLASIVKNSGHIMMAEGIKTSSEAEAEKLFRKGIKEQEGVMFKNIKAKYKAGSRVGYGVKLKSHMKELDLVITEAYYGKGRRSKWFGSFTLSCYDKDNGEYLTIGKLGTGFSDKQLSEINEKLKKYVVEENNERVVLSPKIVVEVRYEEIQKSPTYKSGYALRFPRLVRFRDDKNPDEANSIQYIKKELI